MNTLEVKHLKKYYGKSLGIEDVSIKLNKGEIYGFIGPNGAGKSTTIRTILGLINKNDGHIYLDNEELDINNPSIKEKIGYLPSEIKLYSDMMVKELFDYHESFYHKDIHQTRVKLSKLFKIDEKKRIEDLSLGNLKKVGIVLSLMHEPELLILDEPTSGLDPIMQKILHDLLKEEKAKGRIILYSSHILSEVNDLCDKIGFIKNGQIIKEDTINNIKQNNYTYLTIKSKDIDEIKNDLKLEIKDEKNNEIKFISNLEVNTLINKLTKYHLDKLLIEDITLEDLFENYYRS